MRVVFVFLAFLIGSVFAPLVEADQASFLWKVAKSHRQSGNLPLEEISLKKLFQVDPAYPGVKERLDQIAALKGGEDESGLQSRLDDIQQMVKGDFSQAVAQTGFKSEEEEAEFLERAVNNRALTENQKAQMKEKLSVYYYKKAMDSIKREQVRVAIESLEKSIDYNGSFQLAYYELGFLYFRIRELQRGIANLEKFVDLQPAGILAKNVRETLMTKYMAIARTYYYQQDFKKSKPYLERIIKVNNRSPEADEALTFLMNLYFFQGVKHLQLDDYSNASVNFFQALSALKEKPALDLQLFAKLARSAVEPFLKYAQKLFILDKEYGEAYKYFEAVTWLVPGSSQSFLAREYMKEVQRINNTAENPVVYFSNFIREENERFLLERRGMQQAEG